MKGGFGVNVWAIKSNSSLEHKKKTFKGNLQDVLFLIFGSHEDRLYIESQGDVEMY